MLLQHALYNLTTMNTSVIEANLVDIPNRNIYGAKVTIADGIIRSIEATGETYDQYVLPGFVDAHVHIESSLLVPSEFARMAVVHGTVATVSDPHEIGNVLGVKGVEFMLENAKQVPFHFFFGAPSCVPATVFETAGATITSADVASLLKRKEILYLTEMMNFPGVLSGDEEVMTKIRYAQQVGKPVDGHAPGLRGEQMKQYFDAGITTDHECFEYDEALAKAEHGVKILIREGSAARNFEALIPLMKNYPAQLMFCSDDKHPDSLLLGHINQLVARAVGKGYDLFDVLQAACINPVKHYQLPMGQLQVGDVADCIVVSDLQDFKAVKTYIKGKCVAENGNSLIGSVAIEPLNQFKTTEINIADLVYIPHEMEPVIECMDGELITNKLLVPATECVASDDILKMVVVNRYHKAPVAICYVKNFGIKEGAIASSVAHDSHNIIAVGADDDSICRAVNLIIKHTGGLCAVSGNDEQVLPLPVAGLMSAADAWEVAELYTKLDAQSKRMGSTLRAPFMSLSFMALLVIPHLKLSDLGLFDGDTFSFINK
jgi:adenine deaminase